MERIAIVVRGAVQGVFFRVRAKNAAECLGITGYAENRSDGSVRVIGEGKEPDLAEFSRLIKSGFGDTNVTGIAEYRERATGEFDSFEIR